MELPPLPIPSSWTKVDKAHAMKLAQQSKEIRSRDQENADKILKAHGFSIEYQEGDAY